MRRLILIVAAIAMFGGTAPALAAAPPAPTEPRWAVVIGVDAYQGRTRHNIGAVGDARAFRTLLVQRGWAADHIRFLTDAQATRDAIREAMQWLVDRCTAGTRCVFHYSGHAKQMNDTSDGDGETLHEYLWPHDNRFISDKEFSSYMRQLKGRAWVDVSACEAAGFDHGISGGLRLFTGASQEHEKAFEYPKWSQSVWTGSLVNRAIFDKGGDSNGDGHVTLAEAIPFASEMSARLTKGQPPSPQHPYVKGSSGGWFPPPAPAPAAPRCFLIIFCA